MSRTALICNVVVLVAVIAGYVVLTAIGHDGNPLLAWVGGQGTAVAIHAATDGGTA